MQDLDGVTEPASVQSPLVSVMITAYNRPEELRDTLRILREQTHRPLEVLVVDDASSADLAAVVRAEWPDARFWRNDRNRGYIVNRSSLMAEARGDFILSLDDDSSLTRPDDLERALARMAREPRLGVLSFLVHEGLEPPAPAPEPQRERYVQSYIGCAHLLRTAMVRELGGYHDFFEYYAEEAEYCLRALNHGWRILLFPEVVVHHRLSPVGRSGARIWGYGFRNSLWSVTLHMPFPRVVGEVGWKLLVNGMEMVRIGQPRWGAWALGSYLRGLPAVMRLRRPLTRDALRAYDALRFREVHTPDELEAASRLRVGETWRWFTRTWRTRRRARPFWDRRDGGLGVSVFVADDQPRAPSAGQEPRPR
ncbi:MAG TPA: glycosyltransferase [Longimicrobium sp.]|jgi:GT2 family glycosyltransferase|uniref:glycosyltransferase family 2 protein n=1 Tax=Longimicrobium sp. TaxID=2029185 RepID=UPI002EDB85EA